MNTMINIKSDLANWVIDYITNAVHNTTSDDSTEFNNWAKSFDRDEAKVVVSMEFGNDWGYDTRTEIAEEEAEKYAQKLLQVILNNWYK